MPWGCEACHPQFALSTNTSPSRQVGSALRDCQFNGDAEWGTVGRGRNPVHSDGLGFWWLLRLWWGQFAQSLNRFVIEQPQTFPQANSRGFSNRISYVRAAVTFHFQPRWRYHRDLYRSASSPQISSLPAMPRLFSYVVDHDDGRAPYPKAGKCTLAKCKFGSTRRNVVEMAEEGDWIAGTGGADPRKSAGHGRLVYAMRVDQKMPLVDYCRWMNGKRLDAEYDDVVADGRFALISHHFFYFGCSAPCIPPKFLDHPFEKKGRGYRSDFNEAFIEDFTNWLESNFPLGAQGTPCRPHPNLPLSTCSSSVKCKRAKRRC